MFLVRALIPLSPFPVPAVAEAPSGSVAHVGTVERILLRPEAAGVSYEVPRAQALEGLGLQGDRYFNGEGTFYEDGKSGQDLTLIEAEALEALRAEHGIALRAEEAGRNLLTRGVDLNALV